MSLHEKKLMWDQLMVVVIFRSFHLSFCFRLKNYRRTRNCLLLFVGLSTRNHLWSVWSSCNIHTSWNKFLLLCCFICLWPTQKVNSFKQAQRRREVMACVIRCAMGIAVHHILPVRSWRRALVVQVMNEIETWTHESERLDSLNRIMLRMMQWICFHVMVHALSRRVKAIAAVGGGDDSEACVMWSRWLAFVWWQPHNGIPAPVEGPEGILRELLREFSFQYINLCSVVARPLFRVSWWNLRHSLLSSLGQYFRVCVI